MKILHITTHLGGGVGDTIVGYSSVSEHENTVISLGYSFDYRHEQMKVPYYDNMCEKHEEIIKIIPDFDIVIIHWWNHPLLYDFLVRNKLPRCRLIIWSHNSGLYPPNIYTKKLVAYPDVLVFTSPLSFKTEIIVDSKVKKYNIWSTGGVENYLKIKRQPHKNFIVGYVGTIDYAKMHPNFLRMCSKIKIPNVEFMVVGNAELIKDAKGNFTFPGFVQNLGHYYSMIDVFGYPLNPTHYGTCDLVLQIAMAAGSVPVVLSNPMELTIVEHMKTGLVANNEKEYVEAIEMLYNNPTLREELSLNARKEAEKRFTLKKLCSEWNVVFNEIMKYEKTVKKWDIKEPISYTDVFLESLGEHCGAFRTYHNAKYLSDIIFAGKRIRELGKKWNWRSKSKGTVHNYVSYFKEKELKEWSELMK